MKTLGDVFAKSCDGKVRHEDYASAHHAALLLQEKEGCAFNTYHCLCCGKWHNGHREPK